MRRMNSIFLMVSLALSGCGQAINKLSIDDAKAAGFEKDQQKIFQIVGANDGWSGEWAGDRVELYLFSDQDSVNREAFQASVQPNNISGWVEMCVEKNLLMLSKGENACRELNRLAE
ncbi:hypothetical protein [Alishewanella sp. WH16-1]|uniref:hypothetical protein n=1 Tax=Alishewanella sp. WH16-1 TaxID=1651088 RepID=UPI00070D350F|nr:hypothetical protein [Alishewanella sp. WH16-1]